MVSSSGDSVGYNPIALDKVNGLQTALDGKANTNHGHAIGDITGLQTALNGKLVTADIQTWARASNSSLLPLAKLPTSLLRSVTQNLNTNIVTFQQAGGGNTQVDLTKYVNRTGGEIATLLFSMSHRDTGEVNTETTFNIPEGDQVDEADKKQVLDSILSLNQAEADAANGGSTVRITARVEWQQESGPSYPPSVLATIRSDGTKLTPSIHLRPSQTATLAVNLPASGNNAGDVISVEFDGTNHTIASSGRVIIHEVTISEQGEGTSHVTSLADAEANKVVSPLRTALSDVATVANNNNSLIQEQTVVVTGHTALIGANTDEIRHLQLRPRFQPTQALHDFIAVLLEAHVNGAITYLPPYTSLLRATPNGGGAIALSLDTTGVVYNANIGGRRGITGLGPLSDKVVFVTLSNAAEHALYIRIGSGSQVFYGIHTDDSNNRYHVFYDPDENVGLDAGRQIVRDGTGPVPYIDGDLMGYNVEVRPGGNALYVIPVIFRAAGGNPIQGNDIEFNSANAVTHFNADAILIHSGDIVEDIWVARHTGASIFHSQIAHADPATLPGLGIRSVGTGREELTLNAVMNFAMGLQSEGETVAKVTDIADWAKAGNSEAIPGNKLGNAGAAVTYPIEAFVRVAHGADVSSLSLNSGGVWNDATQTFTTKPTATGVTGAAVFGISDLPAGAESSSTYDFYIFRRLHREGETAVPANSWRARGKLDHDTSASAGSVAPAEMETRGTGYIARNLD